MGRESDRGTEAGQGEEVGQRGQGVGEKETEVQEWLCVLEPRPASATTLT